MTSGVEVADRRPEAVAVALAIPHIVVALADVMQHMYQPAPLGLLVHGAAPACQQMIDQQQHYTGFVTTHVNHLELKESIAALRLQINCLETLHDNLMAEKVANV